MRTSAALLSLASIAFLGAPAAAGEEAGWRVRLTPYLWAPSIDGTLRIDGVGGGGEDDGGSVLDDFAGGGMLALEARRGDWSILGDVVVTHFELQGDTDGPGSFAYESSHDEIVAGLALGHTLARGEEWELQGLFGLRYLHVDLSLDSRDGSSLDLSGRVDLFDPIVGLRGRLGAERGLFGLAHADVGGFGVSSDLTWQVIAGAGWAWSWGDVRLGWRTIAYDFDSGGILYDLTASGPFVGVSFAL